MNKSPVASVAACRKKYIDGRGGGAGPVGRAAVPGRAVALRAGAAGRAQHRFPRRSKTVLCVFLGAGQGLAVMVSGGLPLAWKSFSLPAGAKVRRFFPRPAPCGSSNGTTASKPSPEYAIIHGRPDLHERLQQEQFPSNMETRVLWREGPELDAAATAFGLALGCLAQNAKAFDLSRSLKARPSLWEIFPWGDLAFTAVLVACAGLFLGAHATKLDDSYATATAQSSRYKCLSSAEPGSLEQETKDLEKKIEAVRKFLDTRILWTSYTADLSARLPANAVLNHFDAHCGLDIGGRAAGRNRPSPRGQRSLWPTTAPPRAKSTPSSTRSATIPSCSTTSPRPS